MPRIGMKIGATLRRMAAPLLFVCWAGLGFAHERPVAGYLEIVTLYPSEINVSAQLNTASPRSYLYAQSIHLFERADEEWVRFVVFNNQGEAATFERKIVGVHAGNATDGERTRKPIVRMQVCLGKIYRTADFVVESWKTTGYRAMLGRTFMGRDILIDSGRPFTTNPGCNAPASQ